MLKKCPEERKKQITTFWKWMFICFIMYVHACFLSHFYLTWNENALGVNKWKVGSLYLEKQIGQDCERLVEQRRKKGHLTLWQPLHSPIDVHFSIFQLAGCWSCCTRSKDFFLKSLSLKLKREHTECFCDCYPLKKFKYRKPKFNLISY